MSKHVSRKDRWKQINNQFESDFGQVFPGKDGKWIGMVFKGSKRHIVGDKFKRPRNAMIGVEDAARDIERGIKKLP